jgi:hypothetical protein
VPDVVQPAPVEAVVEEAPAAPAEPAARPSLFTEFAPSKRFSFFRGARR